MFKRSTWLHLRIPFSFFLLPIYLFALAISPNIDGARIVIVLVALHLFLYPASNGYNSYFDKDEGSIGGLKKPPKVTKGLYFMALLFDLVAIGLALKISLTFAAMVFIYGLVSKAYSHPAIRLKKYPYVSWLVAGFFQGCFTFLMVYVGINDYAIETALQWGIIFPGLLTSMILWGSYPMTQIYQHEEDASRGDNTLSLRLGIKGTFHFTAVAFTIAVVSFVFYFNLYHQISYGLHFVVSLLPVLLYFGYWYMKVRTDETAADYTRTMWLNFISALCLNAFFIYFFLDSSQILQAVLAGY